MRWGIVLASPSALLRMMRARALNEVGNEQLRANDTSAPGTHQAIAAWQLEKTSSKLETLAIQKDIPLTTLSHGYL